MDYLSYNGSDGSKGGGGSRFIIFVCVMMLLFVGMSYFAPRPDPQIEADSNVEHNEPAKLADIPLTVNYPVAKRTIETDNISVQLTNAGGGRVSSVTIKSPDRYLEHGEFIRSQKSINDEIAGIEPFQVTLNAFGVKPETRFAAVSNENDHQRAEFAYTDPQGKFEFRKSFAATDTPYVLRVRFDLTNRSAETVSDIMAISLFIKQIEGEEPGIFQPGSFVAAKCYSAGSMEYLDVTDKDESENYSDNLKWFGVDESYFAMAMTAGYGQSCEIINDDGLMQSRLNIPVALPAGQSASYEFDVFLGPKEAKYLEAAFGEDNNLDSIIDYGWMEILAKPMAWILDKFHSLLGNWGLAIILLTLIVRGLLWPIAQKSQISMMQMSKLAPLMQEIQEKYKDDPAALQQKQIELYQKYHVSPFGCLPLLLQMPIFFALYRCIFVTGGLYHAEFYGWIHDLSARDPYFILPLLSVGLIVLQQLLTPQTVKNKQQKIMMFMMPIIFGAMMLFLPSGLCLYMVVSSAFSMIQSFYVRRMMAEQDKNNPIAAAAGDIIDVENLASKDKRAAKRRNDT